MTRQKVWIWCAAVYIVGSTIGNTSEAFSSIVHNRRRMLSKNAPQRHAVAGGQPKYELAGSSLSESWINLVREGKVSATVELLGGDDETTKIPVTYGVRLVQQTNGEESCQEFVLDESEATNQAELNEAQLKIKSINETLAELQEQPSSSGGAVKFVVDDDNFAAQLQLVRTLRPPPSDGFAGSTSSKPPPYEAEQDSFVTGPLRLELRPLVATLQLPGMTSAWDVFHNVSPADARGHFLLIPTLQDKTKNWRGQLFLEQDCHDLVHLASSIRPVGSLLLGYNSVGAGASQNHIHCHAWPSPPLPLLYDNKSNNDLAQQNGWECYAVSKETELVDVCDAYDGHVEVSFLDYPVFCIRLSAAEPHLDQLGQALATALSCISGASPYNIGFLNRIQEDEDEEDDSKVTMPVDVYLFVRSKERSSTLPSLKLGISEMMGVFHAQSNDELDQLIVAGDKKADDGADAEDDGHDHDHDKAALGPMAEALLDISVKEEAELWDRIKEALENL